jgi:hypothetical protein
MDDLTKGKENGNGNGKGKANGDGKPTAGLPDETKKEIAEQQAGAEKAAANGKAGKKSEKAKKPEKGKKGKLIAFEPKPVPEAVKPIAEAIEKVTDLENLKAVARVLKRHWRKVYEAACKKATEGLKAGSVVWFKHGSKLIGGKVVKVKTNGKVKIDGEDGKTWRVPGTMVHKGKPTGADRAEVTKKAA